MHGQAKQGETQKKNIYYIPKIITPTKKKHIKKGKLRLIIQNRNADWIVK